MANCSKGSMESKSIEKIKVMASHRVPFVIRGENLLRGLDIDIVENFAKKHQLKMEYFTPNETLHEIFDSEDRFEIFLQINNHS